MCESLQKNIKNIVNLDHHNAEILTSAGVILAFMNRKLDIKCVAILKIDRNRSI